MKKSFKNIIERFRNYHPPKLLKLYLEGIKNGEMFARAKSVSWSLILSVFPFLIFVFSILPYMPHFQALEQYFVDLVLSKFLPDEVRGQALQMIDDILKNKKFNLGPISFVLVLYFSSNGISALLNGFRSIYLEKKKKRPLKNFGLAVLFTLAVLVYIVTSLLLVYYFELVWSFVETEFMHQKFKILSRWMGIAFTTLFLLLGLCILYKVGSQGQLKWKEVLPGAVITIIFSGLLTTFFAFYIANFTKFNAFYGSLGSFFILMLWIYFNIVLVFMGYEFNASLKKYKIDKYQTSINSPLP